MRQKKWLELMAEYDVELQNQRGIGCLEQKARSIYGRAAHPVEGITQGEDEDGPRSGTEV